MRFFGFRNNAFLSKEDRDFRMQLKSLMGFTPHNLFWYKKAFAHASLQKVDEHGNMINNERLEFLGDAILSSIVASYLFHEFPNRDEGFLTSMRSKMVSRKHLNKLGLKLKLPKLLDTNLPDGNRGKSIYGDALEALIGAIYKDRGFGKANLFVRQKLIGDLMVLNDLEQQVASYKSKLIEWAQKHRKVVSFEVVSETGEQHNLTYEISVSIDAEVLGQGMGRSKKNAEEAASRLVCENLHIL